jgi:hypothetical protein
LTLRREEQGPNPVDIDVGTESGSAGRELGLSQQKLGNAIGVTLQQIQNTSAARTARQPK